MIRNCQAQQGFTLVEVLIALLIVSLSFAGFIISVNQNVRTLWRLEEKVAASWVAEDVIAQAQLGLLRANSGTQRMLNRDWRWQVRTRPTENAYVQALEITVEDQQKNTVFTLSGYNGVDREQ